MLRLHPDKKNALSDINKAIRILKENGEIAKVYAKYH
jgi:ABC-type amino acid transport substrate-binding protein